MPITPVTPAFSNIGAIGASIEVTPGTAVAPTFPADFILASDVQYTPNFTAIERNFLRPSFSRPLQLVGRQNATLSFTVEVMGTGVAATGTSALTQAAATPKWADLLEGCGFAGVNSAGPTPPLGRTYSPVTNNMKTLTIDFHANGQRHRMTGSVGTFTINAPAGGIATMTFTFSGNYVAPTVTSDPSMPSLTVVPPIVQNAAFTLGGYAGTNPMGIQEFTFDMGNNIVERESISSPFGFDGFFITSRAPTATINPERILEGSVAADRHPFFADASSAASRTMSLQIGSAAGNRVLISMPAVQLQNIAIGDRNGMMTYDLSYTVSSTSTTGNDEVTFLFS